MCYQNHRVDFDFINVKENTIPHFDALSRPRFQMENGEKHENLEDIIISVEKDVLYRKTICWETQQDPILRVILERIRKNVWSNCAIAEIPLKKVWHKLTVEKGIIYNTDDIVLPQNLRKDIIKSVHDDIYGGARATQRRLGLRAWWPGYCKDDVEHLRRCPKCTEIKTVKPTEIHT